MRRVALTSVAFGIAFGFLLAWTGLARPEVIRSMLLLESAYVYLVMFSAIGVAMTLLALLTRRPRRALVTGQPLALERARPRRRHVTGAALFGLGWSLTLTCPGPIAVQLGQGFFWAVFTLLGVLAGIRIRLWHEQREAAGELEAAGAVST